MTLRQLLPILLLCSLWPASSVAQVQVGALSLSGRVLDAQGLPVVGATVVLQPLLDDYQEDRLRFLGRLEADVVASTRTGRRGWFEIVAPEVGFWRLVVRAEGFVPMRRDLQPLLRPAVLPAPRLRSARELEVEVTGAAGAPVSGVLVRLGWVDSGGPWSSRACAASGWWPADRFGRTGEAGTVRMPVLDGERLVAETLAEGHAPAARTVPPPGGKLTLELGPCLGAGCAGTRLFQVLDPKGRPAPDVVVRGGRRPLAMTDADGRVALPRPFADQPLRFVDPGGARWTALPRDGLVRQPAPKQLEGLVVDAADGRGLRHALVWARHPFFWSLRTEAGGGFRWPADDGGPLQLLAASPGYLQASVEPERSREAAAAEGLVLRLQPGRSLGGRLVDEHGVPVAGERVSIRLVSQPLERARDHGAVTDLEGEFRFDDLRLAESYQLRAIRPGSPPAIGVADAATSWVELAFEPGSKIIGRLVDEQGEAIAAGTVESFHAVTDAGRRLEIDQAGRSAPLARTDAEGRFALVEVPAGRHGLLASAPGHVDRVLPGVEVEAGRPQDLGDIALLPATPFLVRVLDARGRPIPEVEVTLSPRNVQVFGAPEDRVAAWKARRRSAKRQRTDEHGEVIFEELERGMPVRLRFSHRDYLEANLEASIGDPLEQVLQAGLEVRGRVVDGSGQAVSGAWVALHGKTDHQGSSSSVTTAGASLEDGGFVVPRVPAGELELTAHAKGFTEYREKLHVEPGNVLDDLLIVLSRGVTLRGRVSSSDGLWAPAARVGLFFAGHQGSKTSKRTETDAEGSFEIVGLPPVAATLKAAHGELGHGEMELRLEPGMAPVSLVLHREVQVAGRVIDDSGHPVEGAQVSLSGGDTHLEHHTRAEGEFRFFPEQAGTYRLRVFKEGLVGEDRWLDAEKNVPIEGLELRLTAGARVVGTILGLAAEHWPAVSIHAVPEEVAAPQGLPRQRFRSGSLDFTGNFRILGLSPGRWHLKAKLEGSARKASASVEIAAGDREVVCDVEFEP